MTIKQTTNNTKTSNSIYQKQFENEKSIRPLQLNLLLIRETLRAMYMHNKSGMSKVYKQLGISTDLYTRFLDTGDISEKSYYTIRHNLMTNGFADEYLKKKNAKLYRACGLLKLQKKYYDPSENRDTVCAELRQSIHELFIVFDPEIFHIVFVCYRLMNSASPSNESTLFVAAEALHKVSTMKLTRSKTEEKITFNFFNELKNTIINLTNQYVDKPTIDVKTLMDTTTVFLQYILSSEITKADAQSQECIQMMHEISKTMLCIHQTLNK